VRLTSVRCFLTSVKFLTERRAAMCGIVSLHRRIFCAVSFSSNYHFLRQRRLRRCK